LQVGCPIILQRTLSQGLYNGQRLIVQQLLQNVIVATIATGDRAGESVALPRIPFTPTDTRLPFQIRRKQFPVRAAFAMTINKSQGQTFKMVGVYLPRPVFSHGQLYVAASRSGSPGGDDEGTVFLVPGSGGNGAPMYTRNIVYREVLLD
jgi:ATP-dependent DNA helicase PIF1